LVGQIEDVLVDLNRSNVVAVVLSVGGFLGVNNKLVAVPVNQIKVGTEVRFTT
jgi:Zn finger protein HypA/HybF involved in hydrogenase expression